MCIYYFLKMILDLKQLISTYYQVIELIDFHLLLFLLSVLKAIVYLIEQCFYFLFWNSLKSYLIFFALNKYCQQYFFEIYRKFLLLNQIIHLSHHISCRINCHFTCPIIKASTLFHFMFLTLSFTLLFGFHLDPLIRIPMS